MNGVVVFVFVRLVWDVVSGAVVIRPSLHCNRVLIVLGLFLPCFLFLTVHPFVYASHGFFAVFSFTEGGQSYVSFS